MDPDTDVCQTEQPQISYSVDFTAEQSSAMGSPILLDREGSVLYKLIRRLQYSPSNRRHEAAHDVLGIVTASEYGSRCAHMYDL